MSPGRTSPFVVSGIRIERKECCDPIDSLPWHRIVGVGGAIKLKSIAAIEQRNRLRLEGVKFSGRLVDMASCEHHFRVWDID
ncbi:MAG: hypothetical protein WAK20_12435 [Candidatus Acidiferrum sp.]